MSYYVRENGIVVKKEGPNPAARYIKSYYRPGDDNVYHCESTPEEKRYWREQSSLELEYKKVEYAKNATGKEKELLTKINFLDRPAMIIYYRKWGIEDNIHWCTATWYFGKDKPVFIGSSGQEFTFDYYGTYWAFTKSDFVPLPNGRTNYPSPRRYY